MTELELSAEATAVIAKVEKLLALAGNNTNEAEAASATAKAMELLAAYNLDMAIVGKTAKGSQRKDTRLKGGLYGWQRSLWNAVAKLNFCSYWYIRGLSRGSTYEHRILGRTENVAATKVMADYLQQAVERYARDYAAKAFPGQSIFIREMIAFREGMATKLYYRLELMRGERLAEDKRKQDEARARHSSGDGSGTGIVLASIIQTEEDLNTDYLNGYEPGTTARRRAEADARRAAAMAAAEAWELAHPDEAAAKRAADKAASDKWWAEHAKKEEAKARRRAKQPTTERYRAETPEEQRRRMSTFGAGYAKGDEVGLDKQIDNTNRERIAK